MCSGLGQAISNFSTTGMPAVINSYNMNRMTKLSVETEDCFSSLLESAANNDVEALRRSIELDLSAVDDAGLWYVRRRGLKQITQEERTPLMVAATYGSVDVLKLIVALPEVDLNRTCGQDKWTALHCAAFGGSINAFDVVKLLLSAGADPNIEDSCGCRPIDVIVVHPKLHGNKVSLEDLLMNNNTCDGSVGDCNLRVSMSTSISSCPESMSPHSPSNSVSTKFNEKKQYPIDQSIPDIRNSIYATDEFRMFSFKVRPCSRAYSHDWTECPFVHPGENARRRDPRKYHYSCVPCPDFRKGACRRGDMCEYAHGVFECWLHPAQYRTRLCKDGTSCARQVCFFAHMHEELRPLYVSTGSGVPSPRPSASFMDMAAALTLLPNSPTSHSVVTSPSAFNQILSPNNGIGMPPHPSAPWPQPNVPTLHLPGSNLQSSRLRSSLSARDIPPEDFNVLRDCDAHLRDVACFSQPHINSSMLSHSGWSQSTLTPSNLEEVFSAEMTSSPRFSDEAVFFSPTHKSAVINQFQQQQQNILSPINTNVFSSSRNVVEHPLLQGMSPRSLETASPLSTRLPPFSQRGSPIRGWTKWGPTNGKADWSVGGDDQACLKRSVEFKDDGDEPDVSWVQSLVKESPPEMMDKDKLSAASTSGAAPSGECLKSNLQIDSIDHTVLKTWVEEMQLDQLVV